MSPKRKLIVSVASMCVVFILGIVSISIIFAASQQKMSASIQASFTATDISGEVTAQYGTEGGNQNNMTTTGTSSGSTVVKFTGLDGTQSMQLTPQVTPIYMQADKPLIFTYTFKNHGDIEYYVKVLYPQTQTNVNVMKSINDANFTPNDANSVNLLTVPASNGENNPGITTLKVKVDIADINSPASYMGDFKFDLTKTAPGPVVELKYEGLDASGNVVTQNTYYSNRNTVNLAGTITQYQVAGSVLTNAELPEHSRVVIPDTYNGLPVTKIKSHAFSDMNNPFTKIEDVKIGNNITSIDDYAFDSCTSLTSIIIPDTVTIISHFAFNHCSGLTSITIGDSVTDIGDSAFRHCSNVTKITIPAGVKRIGLNALHEIQNLFFEGTCSQWNSFNYMQQGGGMITCSDGKASIKQAPGGSN